MKDHSSIKRAERGTPARHRLYVGLFVALAALTAGNAAHAQQRNMALTPQNYSINAGSLGDALNQLATQSKLQIVYSPELVGGKTAPAISGQQTWREALQKLLAGSGLEWGFVNDTTVVIRRSGNDTKPAQSKPAASAHKQAEKAEQKPEPTTLQSVTVTGTRIRGGSTPSPVITIGAENIREEGFTDLGEVIRSVSQNFTGGQNPGVFMGGNLTGGGVANQNVTGGSGLNLRGLGPDASLTLLNGHRMAYGGISQALDISAVPVEAVERIEIMADGASAIYGSDAVGGVANVILKRDFDGVTLGARYGNASDGGMTTREYTTTVGTTWSSGGLIATYKDASVDPIYARQREYSAQLAEPSTIYPGSDLYSGLVSIHQSFGDSIELHVDALRTKRDQTYFYYYGTFSNYNAMETTATATFVSPEIDFTLPNDWMLSIGGSWGKDEARYDQSKVNAISKLSAPYFYDCYCNKSRTYEVNAEGPLFHLDGGDARLAVGAGYRTNEYLDTNLLTNAASVKGNEGSRFVYGEISLPLIGDESRTAQSQRLDFTAAFRSEDYDSFGRITTPKLGIIYNPDETFTLKTSWGKSFKTPTLNQQHLAVTGVLYPGSFGGTGYAADETMLLFVGGNPDLKPERARTWTTSLAFHPELLPGLEMELTGFNISYANRVVQPIQNYNESLSNPNYREFVNYSPTVERQAEMLALARNFYNVTSMPYGPSKVIAIVDGRYVNATQQRIKGIDLSGSYRFDLGTGQMMLRGSTSWLDSTQQTKGTPTPYDLAGTLNNPGRLHSRIGAIWSDRGFSASLFANYASGVVNSSDGIKSASFTTFDGTLRYSTDRDNRWWSGLDFALTVNNLLDRAPPLYHPIAPAYVAPYDSTNYSAIGRYLSLSVSKHF